MAIREYNVPSNLDILDNYAGSLGREGGGEAGNIPLLLETLRRRHKMAQEGDVQSAESLQSGGKATLETNKTFRDYSYARLANPKLRFVDFMRNPAVASKWVTQGVKMAQDDPSLMPKAFKRGEGMGTWGTALQDIFDKNRWGRGVMEGELGAKPQSYGQVDREMLAGQNELKSDMPFGDSRDERIIDKHWRDLSESSSGAFEDFESMLQRKVMADRPERLSDLTGFNPVKDDLLEAKELYEKGTRSALSGMPGSRAAQLTQTLTPDDLGIGRKELMEGGAYQGFGKTASVVGPNAIPQSLPDSYQGFGGKEAYQGFGKTPNMLTPMEGVAESVPDAYSEGMGLGDVLGLGSDAYDLGTRGLTPSGGLSTAGNAMSLASKIPGLGWLQLPAWGAKGLSLAAKFGGYK